MPVNITSYSFADEFGNSFTSGFKGCVGDKVTLTLNCTSTTTWTADTEVRLVPSVFPVMPTGFLQGYWKYIGAFYGFTVSTWYTMQWVSASNPTLPLPTPTANGDFVNNSTGNNVRIKYTSLTGGTTFIIEWTFYVTRQLEAASGEKALDILLGDPLIGYTNPKDWKEGGVGNIFDVPPTTATFNFAITETPSYLNPNQIIVTSLTIKAQGAWYQDWLNDTTAKFTNPSYALTIGGVAATGLSAYDNAVLTFQADHSGLNTACTGKVWLVEDNNYIPGSGADKWEEILRPGWTPVSTPTISRTTLGAAGSEAIGSSTAPANIAGSTWECTVTTDYTKITYGKTYWFIIQYDDSPNEAADPFRTTFAAGPFVADALPTACLPLVTSVMEDYNKSTPGNYLPILTDERFKSTLNLDWCECGCSDYVWEMSGEVFVPAIGDTFVLTLPGILGASWTGTDTAGDIDSMLADIQTQVAAAYPGGEVYIQYTITSPTTFSLQLFVDECWYATSAGVPINGVDCTYNGAGISGGFNVQSINSFYSYATGFPFIGDFKWAITGVDITSGAPGDTYTLTLPNETGVTVPFNTDIWQTMFDMRAAIEAAFDPGYVRVGYYFYDSDGVPPTVAFLIIHINKCWYAGLYGSDPTGETVAATSTDPAGWSAPTYMLFGNSATTATNADFNKVIVRVIDNTTLINKTIVLEEAVATRVTVSGGYSWVVSNPKLTMNVIADGQKYELTYESRARYEPSVPELYTFDTAGVIYYNQSNQAWSNPTQNAAATSRQLYLEWQFVSDHTSPTTYSDVVNYKQKLSCKGFDPVVGFVPAIPAYGIESVRFLDAIGGSEITQFCAGDDVVVEVKIKALVGVDAYNLIAMIEPVPYGVANIQEEETYAGNLTQLATVSLYDVESLFDATDPDTAYFKIDTSALTVGVTYRVHTLAKKV